jgi:hypothetical protein
MGDFTVCVASAMSESPSELAALNPAFIARTKAYGVKYRAWSMSSAALSKAFKFDKTLSRRVAGAALA